MDKEGKAQAYHALMGIRRLTVLWMFALPLIVILAVLLEKVNVPLPATILCWAVTLAILWFRLRAHDYCPWCRMTFFVKNPMTFSGFDYLLRRNCANCGCPSHCQKPNE